MRIMTALFFATSLFVLPSAAHAIDRSEMADLIERAASARNEAVSSTYNESADISFTIGDDVTGRFYNFSVRNGSDSQSVTLLVTPFENRGNPGAITNITDLSADGSVDSGQDPGIRKLDGEVGEEWRGFFQATYDKAWEILKSTLASPPK